MSSSNFPSKNPLNYQGTSVTTPPEQYFMDRAPLSTDWVIYNIGDEWLDKSASPSGIWYKLVSKARQPSPADPNERGVWKQITSLSQYELSGLTGDNSTTVYPSSSGLIQIQGTVGQVTVTEDVNNHRLTLALANGGTPVDSIIPDTGTSPVIPTSTGQLTLSGSGSIHSVGGTNTLTYELTGLTNHNVLVGSGTSTITKIAPSASLGIPLISQGSSADPLFGTAVVGGGGTGVTSFVAYTPVCGGTTTTGALQSVASTGFSGQLLVSNGASSLPSFQFGPPGIVFIEEQSASDSASIIFDNLQPTAYRSFYLVINTVVPATDGAILRMEMSNDNGSTWISSYTSGINYNDYNSTTLTNANSATVILLSGASTNTNRGIDGTFSLLSMNQARFATVLGSCIWSFQTSLTDTFGNIVAACGDTGINALRLTFSSGNITRGSFVLYGIYGLSVV